MHPRPPHVPLVGHAWAHKTCKNVCIFSSQYECCLGPAWVPRLWVRTLFDSRTDMAILCDGTGTIQPPHDCWFTVQTVQVNGPVMVSIMTTAVRTGAWLAIYLKWSVLGKPYVCHLSTGHFLSEIGRLNGAIFLESSACHERTVSGSCYAFRVLFWKRPLGPIHTRHFNTEYVPRLTVMSIVVLYLPMCHYHLSK